MSIFKLSLAVFLACVCLRFWVDSDVLVDVLRAAAGVACVSLLLDK